MSDERHEPTEREGPEDSPRRPFVRRVPLLRDVEMLPLLRPTYEPLFTACVACERALQEPDAPLYVVERALRGREPIFEYAMCVRCMGRTRNELSQESRQRLDRHFEESFAVEERRRQLLDDADAESLVARCALTGRSRDTCDSFQVVGLCADSRLLLNEGSPILLSDKAIDDIFPMLSQRTRDRLDEFTRDHLGLPPALRELPVIF